MPNFPTSKDDGTSLPNPAGTDKQNSPDHGALHTAENAAIIAIETKLGTGSSIPAANMFLMGNGAGTSVWQSPTSAQLALAISDETGSGALVFGTTPTLVTPKVDTINESTPANGVTIDGVNLKDAQISTANAVPAVALAANSVTTAKLGTGADFQPTTVEQNPYKFSAYNNGNQSIGTSQTQVTFNTELYDTSSNYASNAFTAPISGFYHFDVGIQVTAVASLVVTYLELRVNGTIKKEAGTAASASNNTGNQCSADLKLVASDVVTVFCAGNVAFTCNGGAEYLTFFNGRIISAT